MFSFAASGSGGKFESRDVEIESMVGDTNIFIRTDEDTGTCTFVWLVAEVDPEWLRKARDVFTLLSYQFFSVLVSPVGKER